MTKRTANKIGVGLHEAIGYAKGWNEAIAAAARVAENKMDRTRRSHIIAAAIRALAFGERTGESNEPR